MNGNYGMVHDYINYYLYLSYNIHIELSLYTKSVMHNVPRIKARAIFGVPKNWHVPCPCLKNLGTCLARSGTCHFFFFSDFAYRAFARAWHVPGTYR